MEDVKGIKVVTGWGGGACAGFCPTAESVRCAVIAVATGGDGRRSINIAQAEATLPPNYRAGAMNLRHLDTSRCRGEIFEMRPYLSDPITLQFVAQCKNWQPAHRFAMFCLRNYWTHFLLPNQLNAHIAYPIVRFGTTVPSSGNLYTKF